MEYLYCLLFLFTISVQGMTTPPYYGTTNLLDQGTVSQSSGVVASPGYPNNYPANQTKKVSINLPLHSTVEIRFHYFDLQDCYDCHCDFVEITYFSRFCGSTLPNTNGHLITGDTRERYLEFRFHSDASEEHTGFYLTYNIYMPTTTVQPKSIHPCASPDCPYNCPAQNINYRHDNFGCMICECMSFPIATSPTRYPYSTTPRPGSNSLLLSILLNLETEAEAMELQAKSVKAAAYMAVDVLQQSSGKGWRK